MELSYRVLDVILFQQKSLDPSENHRLRWLSHPKTTLVAQG